MPLSYRVIETWANINAIMEGRHNFLYLDVKDKPTTAIGLLVPDFKSMRALPWLSHDDAGVLRPASVFDLESEWRWVTRKAGQNLRAADFGKSARCFLSVTSVTELTAKRLHTFYEQVKTKERWNGIGDWNPNIQFLCMSICWAAGANGLFKFHRLLEALEANDYKAAAIESHLNEIGNPGLRPRNDLHVLLCEAAAAPNGTAGRNAGIWTPILELQSWLQMSYKRESRATSPLLDAGFTHNWRQATVQP
jgi:hypothetical protein